MSGWNADTAPLIDLFGAGVGAARRSSRRADEAAGADHAAASVSRPRLLHVFPSFDVGGVQLRFTALAQGLAGRFRHTILSLNGSLGAAELVPSELPVAFVRAPRVGEGLPARLAGYNRFLHDEAPDLLVTYNWGAIEFALANALTRLPHLHYEDGFGPEEAVRQLPRRAWTRRLALRQTDVVVPSEALRDIAIQNWRLRAERVHHIPNGVAPQTTFSTSIDSLGLGLPPDLPRIVWAGALRSEKNPLRLVRAFAPLSELAVLIIVGEGPERAAIEHEARRLGVDARVHLLGLRPDSRDLIMQCQVLALSSDTEQMPIVVLEAMDAGLPVASTDVGDVRRMLAEENAPFVSDLTDHSLSSALRALVCDAALRTRLGEANRCRARGFYTHRAMIESHEALINGLTAGGGRRR